MSNPLTILRVDSSARKTGSKSRALSDQLINALSESTPTPKNIITRDLADGIGLHTSTWVEATFTPVDDRTQDHKNALAESDILVAELQKSQVLVIGAPIYNFTISASLKAWIDMVTRAGVTFHYTDQGPEGLLKNIKTYIVYAAGGTKVGSEIDFSTNYLKHILAFNGITDVTIVASADDIPSAVDAYTQAA